MVRHGFPGWFGDSPQHSDAALKGWKKRREHLKAGRVIDFWKPEDFVPPTTGERQALQKAGFLYLDRVEVSTVSGMVERATIIGISPRGILTVIYDDGKLDHISQSRVDWFIND